MIRRELAPLLFCLACGSKSAKPATEPDAPVTAETVVVIPEVTEEQTKKAEKEPPAPTGVRDPIAMAESLEGSGADSDMWGGAASGPRGGPDCTRAANCCLSFYSQQPQQSPDLVRVCNNLRGAPSSMCAMLYTQFQRMAPTTGGSCP